LNRRLTDSAAFRTNLCPHGESCAPDNTLRGFSLAFFILDQFSALKHVRGEVGGGTWLAPPLDGLLFLAPGLIEFHDPFRGREKTPLALNRDARGAWKSE
jgi:hypothetical protein